MPYHRTRPPRPRRVRQCVRREADAPPLRPKRSRRLQRGFEAKLLDRVKCDGHGLLYHKSRAVSTAKLAFIMEQNYGTEKPNFINAPPVFHIS